jgi:hypothetical protein
VTQLVRPYAEGRLEEKPLNLTKPKLLGVDELGYLPLEPNAQLVNSNRLIDRGLSSVTR